MRTPEEPPADHEVEPEIPTYPQSSEGVDLSLIHRLKAMTPTERLRDLMHLSEQMRRLRDNARRV